MLAAALVRLRSLGEDVPGQPEASARKHTCMVAGRRCWPGREIRMRWSRGRDASGWQDPGGKPCQGGRNGWYWALHSDHVIRKQRNAAGGENPEIQLLDGTYKMVAILTHGVSTKWCVWKQSLSAELRDHPGSDSALTVAGTQTRHG